ncbi:TonB-dependent receptor [Flavobacterium sp. SUN052]|uniref:TonB-dependent receptor n=1 Tax=Flavobacterium sp. SUN052 TaxID=3002441 RepID=UPI00237E3071|nr:TonB-dependent receptor [Flavobacterium sp. SUN052]MEC4004255.1 TonB-dependent receptor [Flavobacterium sp. SUN052]
MKKVSINLFSIVFLLMTTAMFSQGKIKGTVIDNELNGSLPGVNIVVKGAATGASTDIDGKFILNTTATSGQVVVSYIGYKTLTINFTVKSGETVDLGTIKLASDSNQLDEVVVKSSVIDVAKDRKTPVAVSTIKASEIQQKLGNQEFPEILKNTPSVYASKAGGGFGDSRVTIRGFSQENIAVMINGVPVNDMENSRVFWSNWAGLSDVTSAMQVQRGLGSSKLAISSVGGTINVITRTSDMKEGGVVSVGTANNNYLKTQTSYSTGKMKNGLSASILLSQTRGDGYVDGTKFEGANYFIALGYEINPKHDIQFTFTGAPQWHNQRGTAITVADYLKYGQNGEPNIKYNADWGLLNGVENNFRVNYYHKPVMSLNWDYKISEKTKLSTVVYGSWGRGGGTNGAGRIRGLNYNASNFRRPDGSINFDLIYGYNSGQTVNIPGLTPTSSTRTLTNGNYLSSTATANNLANGISKISSINSHNWYGGVASLNTKLTDKLTLDFGVDLRTYKGIHYQNVSDLLGSSAFLDNTTVANGVASNGNINDPNRVLYQVYESSPSINPFFNVDHQQKVSYNNDGNVNWLGGFTQLEYTTEKLTAYIQAAVSQQGFKRVDYFKYLASNDLASTPYKNILGGDVKGGINYNINRKHNVFVNAGYYSKQPFFNAVYPNNASLVNGNLTNEKITGFEAGYGFRSSRFNANINLYNTTWKDRYQRSNDVAADNPGGYYDFSGITEVHSGVEVDMNAKVTDKFKVNGMFSLGSWDYKGNSVSNRYDVTNNPIAGGTATTLYLDKVKVGNSAQLTASIGGAYEIVKRVTLDANYLYTDKLYANISPANFATETNRGSLKLPAFGLVDAGFSYKMLVGKNKGESVNFRANVNNLLDKIFIAESSSNNHVKTRSEFTTDALYQTYLDTKTYNGVDTSNTVFYGFGRTWNFSMSYNF